MFYFWDWHLPLSQTVLRYGAGGLRWGVWHYCWGHQAEDTPPHTHPGPCGYRFSPALWFCDGALTVVGIVACCLLLELDIFNLTWLFRLLNHLKTLECKLLGPSYILKVYTCLAHSRPSANTWVWAPPPAHTALHSKLPKADHNLPSSRSWEPIRGSYSGLGSRCPTEKPFPVPSRVWCFLRCSVARARVVWKGHQKNLSFSLSSMTSLLSVLGQVT